MMEYTFLILVLAIVVIVLAIASFTNFALDNEHYDRLKWIVIRWAYLVTFIALIVKTFEIPYGIETVTLVSGIGAMLAGLLDVSNVNYKGEKVTQMFNDDLLRDMLGFDDESEDEEEVEEDEESEE